MYSGMSICDSDHDDVCYTGSKCPACIAVKEVDELKKEIEKLKQENSDLYDQNVEMKECLGQKDIS